MVFVSGPIPEGRAVERHGPTHEPGGEDSLIAAVLNAIYPIGHVYISMVSTNPATLLGFPDSTWAALATGRMLIGIDPADTDFDVVRETGGAKTHGHSDNLSHAAHANGAVSNNASTQAHANGAITTNHAGGTAQTTGNPANHTHDEGASIAAGPGPGLSWDAGSSSTATGTHDHTYAVPSAHGFTQPDAHAVHSHPFVQPDTHTAHSAHAAVNHMPPFIATYIWERTA